MSPFKTFLFFILLSSFSTIHNSILPTNITVSSQDCTPKESILSIGTCFRYVHQLSAYSEQFYLKNTTLDYARNVTKLCDDMNACFTRSQCRDVQRTGKVYKEKCNEIELDAYDVIKCLRSFYGDKRSKKAQCAIGYDWYPGFGKSRGLQIASGQVCLREFANQSCSTKSASYMDLYYGKLVDLVTVDGDGPDNCGSLYDKLEALKCEKEMSEFGNVYLQFHFTKLTNQLDIWVNKQNQTFFTSSYLEVRKCMSRYCYFTNKSIQNIDSIHQEMLEAVNRTTLKTSTNITTFDDCLAHIVKNSDLSNYFCVNQIPKTQKPTSVSMLLEVPTVKMSNFLKDKECMKTVMGAECETMNFETFDEDWEKTQNEMRSTWKKLIGG